MGDSSPNINVIRKIDAGAGRIVLGLHGSSAVFSELSYTYPLKLLSPRIAHQGVGVIYNLTYGGGLVGGDHIYLSIEVEHGAILVLLTQGSTKVFKSRPGRKVAVRDHDPRQQGQGVVPTKQVMDVTIPDHSAIFLLPEPVTCFRMASYNQIQKFRLSGKASAVLLDWITSGRKSRGEEWEFSRYYSTNELWVDRKRIVKDVLLLQDEELDVKPLPPRKLCDRLSPYSCYATVILYGPLVESTIQHLAGMYEAMTVFKRSTAPDLIWSLSCVNDYPSRGGILRVAGKETEQVKKWMGDTLQPLEEVVGTDVYRKAFW
ncbi:hypothetical protein JAAARDRAFT_377342 [Jaapia argillacea MUCL 33604]|uniref:UreD-domain-containing protein n=1 Tax=Jaapia argillacea MUCL 33604 TaxID=933084 RepID=A0A067Q8L9_9AGAM|nr:hypothetical protein JAAARDRAFT_377342 [Jaapia argillacea MUCL 33604]